MYHLSPYTYVIEGLLGQAIGRESITCATDELATLTPPSGQSCYQYMANYISEAGGYLTNPNATSACEFCSTSTTDTFLQASFNISYGHRWRDIGFLCAYVVFNVSFLFIPIVVLMLTIFSYLDCLCIRFHLVLPHPYRQFAWLTEKTLHQEMRI